MMADQRVAGQRAASTVYNGIGGTTNITNAGTIGTTGILGFTAATAQVVTAQGARRSISPTRAAARSTAPWCWPRADWPALAIRSPTREPSRERVARRGRRDVEYVQCADRIVGRPRCRCGPRRQQHAQPAVEHGRRQRRTAPSRSIRSAISPISRWGGTWNINGASTASNASLTGGTAILNNSGGLGTGAIVVGGGTLGPARPG